MLHRKRWYLANVKLDMFISILYVNIANLTGEKYVLVFKEGKLLIDDYGKNSDVYNLNP